MIELQSTVPDAQRNLFKEREATQASGFQVPRAGTKFNYDLISE